LIEEAAPELSRSVKSIPQGLGKVVDYSKNLGNQVIAPAEPAFVNAMNLFKHKDYREGLNALGRSGKGLFLSTPLRSGLTAGAGMGIGGLAAGHALGEEDAAKQMPESPISAGQNPVQHILDMLKSMKPSNPFSPEGSYQG